MKQSPELTAVVAALEAAFEASRELDCAIGVVIGRFVADPPAYEGGDIQYRDVVNNMRPGQAGDMLVPRYTDSIDAALKLLPATGRDVASFWRVGNDGEGADPSLFKAEVVVHRGLSGTQGRATAVTAPIALCLAALKAVGA